jgi:hypothetical protein
MIFLRHNPLRTKLLFSAPSMAGGIKCSTTRHILSALRHLFTFQEGIKELHDLFRFGGESIFTKKIFITTMIISPHRGR